MDGILGGEEQVAATTAAGELQTTLLRVLMLVKRNVLSGFMRDGEWFVTRESLDCAKRHGLDRLQQDQCRSAGCTGCSCSGS